MLTQCADSMSLISEHLYLAVSAPMCPRTWRRRSTASARWLEHAPRVPPHDRRAQGQEHPRRARRVELRSGPNEFGELGVRYFVQDALGIAAGLHEYYRNSDIFFMANYAQTVNVIGAIKTTPTAAGMGTTGLVFAVPAAFWRHAGRGERRAGPGGCRGGVYVRQVRRHGGDRESDGSGAVAGAEGGRCAADRRGDVVGDSQPRSPRPQRPGKPRVVDIREEPYRDAGELNVPAFGVALFELRVK